MSTFTIATHASEGGSHWYTKDGEQVLEIDGKAPDFRNKLVRKHDLAPGVTAVLRMKAAPGLDKWKQQEAIRAALTYPRKPDQTEAQWLDAILADSGETAKAAANEGTRIHAAIQGFFQTGVVDPAYTQHVTAVRQVLADIAPNVAWTSELGVASKWGFGTKSDLHCPRFVIDFKGCEKPRDDLRIYDSHELQLAATRAALAQHDRTSPEARCLIVYVHRTECWAHAIEVKPERLVRGWNQFRFCLGLWQSDKDYCPSWGTDLRTRL